MSTTMLGETMSYFLYYHVNKAVVYGWNLTLWTTTSQMSGDSSQGVIGEGGR